MEQIISLRRPPASLIKLVESLGILLQIPKSNAKSVYKAPLPSNYDQSLKLICEDFYGIICKLTALESYQINNETAVDFYNKLLEPGVDYEDAVNIGGLMVREMFNAAVVVLFKLQSDTNRVPVSIHNMLSVMDGSRAAYSALDITAHACKHGVLNVLVYCVQQHETEETMIEYLQKDIQRRCKSHYKVPDHCLAIHSVENYESFYPSPLLLNAISQDHSCTVISLPILVNMKLDFLYVEDADLTYSWAVWNFPGDLLLSHGLSMRRPFTEVATKRTYLLFLDTYDPDMAQAIYLKALKFFRPGDSVVAVAVLPSRESQGDNRDLRFDFGQRNNQWIRSNDQLKKEPSRIGWNDSCVEELTNKLHECFEKSFITGKVRIEREEPRKSLGQYLISIADEVQAAGIILRLERNKDVIAECLQDSAHSLFILK